MQSSPEQMVIAAEACDELWKDVCAASPASEFPGTPCADREKSTRRSPASKDEFWDALSSHYDYLMDDGLIATCKEASSDLSWDDEEVVPKAYHWSFTQFIDNFKQLHDKLHHLQVVMMENFKESHSEEQKKISFLCAIFNDQGQKLSLRYPAMRDEVHRHLNLLGNKWNAVVQSTDTKKTPPVKDSALSEIATLVRCLRRWLRELEERLCPVSLATKWTVEKLQEKQKEQQILQQEIKAKGKYVSALLNLCERLDGRETVGQSPQLRWDADRFLRVGKNLQKRWHSIWLQSLECQYSLEGLMREKKAISVEKLDTSFTEEPLKKYPRLDGDEVLMVDGCPRESLNPGNQDDAIWKSIDAHLKNCRRTAPVHCGKSLTNDKGIMVGNTGIAELKAGCKGNIGKFEIVQDVGYSSETSVHFSNDEQVDTTELPFHELSSHAAISDASKSSVILQPSSSSSFSSHNNSTKSAVRRLFLAPDKYPSINLQRYLSLSETLAAEPQRDSRFSKSVPDSFYKMTSLDLEASEEQTEVALNETVNPKQSPHLELVSSPRSGLKSPKPFDALECHNSSASQPSLFTSCNLNNQPEFLHSQNGSGGCSPDGHHSEKSKRTARVREWLNRCHSSEDLTSDENPNGGGKRVLPSKVLVNHSCDASGECTTTDSDGEKSCGSDDVNNSLAFSQSFTGSVETVVKVTKEEAKSHSDQAGSIEPSPGVRMRRKKKHSRDRPWSVTELHQVCSRPPRFTHSNSEGALNSMTYSKDNSKSMPSSKKMCLGLKKSSLPDVSLASSTYLKVQCPTSQSSSLTTSTPQSDKSEGCFSAREEAAFGNANAHTPGSERIQRSNTSDGHSISSCNSTSSKSHERKNKRRFKSSQSECSTKQRGNSDGSSIDRKRSAEQLKAKSAVKYNSNPSCPEDQSSVSDQVWDEYQDPPYLSEPYSEQTADEDQVKKLINFGDDYRAALGSQSDASSARSTCRAPIRSRSKIVPHTLKETSIHHSELPNSASDSDAEDFNNILSTSLRALHFVQNCAKENILKRNFAASSEFAELVATCRTNLGPLHAILDELVTKPNCQSFSHCDLQKLRDLIREWEVLQAKLTSMQQQNDDQLSADHVQISVLDVESTLAAQKGKLNAIWNCASEALSGIDSHKELQDNIQDLQSALANLQEMKGEILSVSARILRLMAENGGEAVLFLRDAGAKLYQQWEDVYELSTSQLTKLQSLQLQWRQEKDELQNESLQSLQLEKGEDYFEGSDALSKLECDNDFDQLFYSPEFAFSGNNSGSQENDAKIPPTGINPKSRLWRVLRASMPIHVAIFISYCISCLMQPQCCENMNSLDFSIFPQLRHMQGPPPV